MSNEPTSEPDEAQVATVIPVVPVDKVGTMVLVPRWLGVAILAAVLIGETLNSLTYLRLADARDKQADSLEISAKAQEDIARALAVLEDCTIPSTPEQPRECQARSARTTREAIQTLSLVDIYTVVCLDEKRASDVAELEACISEKLQARGIPPVFSTDMPTTTTTTPPPTGAPSRSTTSPDTTIEPTTSTSTAPCMVTIPTIPISPAPGPSVPCPEWPTG